MHILNIKVCSEDNAIKIYFDSIMLGEQADVLPDNTIYGEMIGNFYYLDYEAVVETLKRQTSNPRRFQAHYQNQTYQCSKTTSIYQLPTDKHLALDFIFAFIKLLIRFKYDYVVFNQFTLDERLIEASRGNYPIQSVLMISIETLLDCELSFIFKNLRAVNHFIHTVPNVIANVFLTLLNIGYDLSKSDIDYSAMADISAKQLIACIQKLNLGEYELLYSALDKIKKWCESKHGKSVHDALELNQRFVLLLNLSLPQYELMNNNEQDKINFIYAVQRQLLSEKRKGDLIHFIDNKNFLIKKKLFQQCIVDKLGVDGQAYRWDSDEWMFLRCAEFLLRTDGKLFVKVPDAVNASNDQNFQRNIQHMFANMELCIESWSIHGGIIFTRDSSDQLAKQGLHLNLAYIKKLLKIKLIGGLFKQAHTYANDKESEPTILHILPIDILTIIYKEIALAMNLNMKEAEAAYNLGWNKTTPTLNLLPGCKL